MIQGYLDLSKNRRFYGQSFVIQNKIDFILLSNLHDSQTEMNLALVAIIGVLKLEPK